MSLAAGGVDDEFAPVRDWWYRGRGLPNPGSEAVARMVKAYAERPDDPDVMQWAALAQTYGLFKTNASAKDLTVAAAGKGQPAAMARLGQALLEGDNVAPDPARGMRLLREALDRGEPGAALELGRAYLQGSGGIGVDLDKAEQFLVRAVEMGHVRAHHVLTALYHKRGDDARALGELRAGAEGGDEGAMNLLAEAYQRGLFGAKREPGQAVEWYRRAAERGSAPAQRELVKGILTGYAGLAQDEKNRNVARALLAKAAGSKDVESMRLLARTYLTGELDTEFAPDRAVELLRGACERKDPIAMYDLGVLYAEGLVVARDLGRAEALMRQSAAAGYRPAVAHLRRFGARGPEGVPSTAPAPGQGGSGRGGPAPASGTGVFCWHAVGTVDLAG